MIASLTRLRLKSFLYLPGFAFYAFRSTRDLRRTAGFVDGTLLPDRRLTFWTLTRWSDEAAMKRWRAAGAHGRSMKKLAAWCDEASVTRWNMDPGGALPDWQECYRRMVTEGRQTPVNQPSEDQKTHTIPPPNTTRAVAI